MLRYDKIRELHGGGELSNWRRQTSGAPNDRDKLQEKRI